MPPPATMSSDHSGLAGLCWSRAFRRRILYVNCFAPRPRDGNILVGLFRLVSKLADFFVAHRRFSVAAVLEILQQALLGGLCIGFGDLLFLLQLIEQFDTLLKPVGIRIFLEVIEDRIALLVGVLVLDDTRSLTRLRRASSRPRPWRAPQPPCRSLRGIEGLLEGGERIQLILVEARQVAE